MLSLPWTLFASGGKTEGASGKEQGSLGGGEKKGDERHLLASAKNKLIFVRAFLFFFCEQKRWYNLKFL